MKKYTDIKNKHFLQDLSRSILFPLIFIALLVFLNGIFIIFDSFFFQGILNFFLSFLFLFVAYFFLYFFVKEKKETAILLFFVSVFLFVFFQNIFIENNLFLFNDQKEYLVKDFLGLNVFSIFFLPLIFLAIINGFIFNKYFSNQKAKFFLSFFILDIAFALSFILIWPIVFFLIVNSMLLTLKLPFGLDAFFYGFFNRLFVIFGSQIIMNALFNYSILGGQIVSITDGAVVAQGEIQIWFYCFENNISLDLVREVSNSGGMLLNNSTLYYFSYGLNPGQYEQGLLIVTIFILPAIAFAFFKNTDDKKRAKRILLFGLLVSLTGLTEPIEILFISSLPIYLFYCFIVGLDFMILDLLDVSVIISMGTIFDLFIFGIFPQLINDFFTNFQFIIYLGFVNTILFYFVFDFLLKRDKISTSNNYNYHKINNKV